LLAEARSLFRAFTGHETRRRLIFSFAARTSARYLVSGALKENVFRIGDDWGRFDRNGDDFFGRKDKRRA
jgi:hypothetical protein